MNNQDRNNRSHHNDVLDAFAFMLRAQGVEFPMPKVYRNETIDIPCILVEDDAPAQLPAAQ